jgi:hypothetical protein
LYTDYEGIADQNGKPTAEVMGGCLPPINVLLNFLTASSRTSGTFSMSMPMRSKSPSTRSQRQYSNHAGCFQSHLAASATSGVMPLVIADRYQRVHLISGIDPLGAVEAIEVHIEVQPTLHFKLRDFLVCC